MSGAFPVLWTAALPNLSIDAPLGLADLVACNAGTAVVAFDARTGAPRWSVELEKETLGRPFFRAADRIVVATRPKPERLTHLTGLDAAGTVCWQVGLGTLAGNDGCTRGEHAFLTAMRMPRGVTFHALDARTGAVMSAPLDWGMQGLTPAGELLLARNRFASATIPGLYFVDHVGKPGARLFDASVYNALTDEHRVYFVTDGKTEDRGVLVVRDLDGVTDRWSTPIGTFHCDANGQDVVHVDANDQRVVIARDAATGAVRWRGEPTPEAVDSLTLAGEYVFARLMDGLHVVRRGDGRALGRVPGGTRAAAHDGRVYVVVNQELQCWAQAGS